MKPARIETTICLFVLSALFFGCDGTQQSKSDQNNTEQTETDSHSHPNLSLHKPKTFSSAVQRLKQLHESLLADGEFPAPIAIQYVEVIHGKGAAGHSHFYSAKDYEANEGEDHHDGHHEEDETVEHHSMEVDLRTEMKDIAAWLPDLAADTNLNEASWTSVNSTADDLTEIINTIAADASDSAFRESWKKKSQEIDTLLEELQSHLESSPGVKK